VIELETLARLGLSFTLALAISASAVPLARALAVRTGFYDRPGGFKQHTAPTPYLGGLAVMAGVTMASLAVLGDLVKFAPLLGCALALAAVGTADDRWSLPIFPRVGAEALAAVVLWEADLGWSVFESDAANLMLTIAWVVGLVNAFNLMDNLDGAAGAVAVASSAGIVGLALTLGATGFAVLAIAVMGACLGFLPWNLARPSRIFLGDGGSMPLGLLIAGLIMGLPDGGLGWAAVLAAVPLVGLLALDTALVVVSRSRRGAPITLGARDHLTHRLLERLGTPLLVAVVLLASQATLDLLAVGLFESGRLMVVNAAALCLVVGTAAILALEGLLRMPLRAERSG